MKHSIPLGTIEKDLSSKVFFFCFGRGESGKQGSQGETRGLRRVHMTLLNICSRNIGWKLIRGS